jgi:hypothetical protein
MVGNKSTTEAETRQLLEVSSEVGHVFPGVSIMQLLICVTPKCRAWRRAGRAIVAAACEQNPMALRCRREPTAQPFSDIIGSGIQVPGLGFVWPCVQSRASLVNGKFQFSQGEKTR